MVAPLVDAQLYQRTVGKFIFFTQTRPDIAFPVNMVSRFSHQPQVLHLDVIKHLIRYIKGTLDQALLPSEVRNSRALPSHLQRQNTWH
jgi:hypothetical protein